MIPGTYRDCGETLCARLARRLEAVELDPRSDRAFFELGKVYEQRGDLQRAMETYHRALAIQFDEPT